MSPPPARLPVRVREMTLADCDRVSRIRVRGWQSAYRGLMPQPYLDAMDVTADAERRRALFARTSDDVVHLVAEDESGEVVGWACVGPYRDGEARTADAELYALYVDIGRAGAGVGQTLLRESVRRCETAGQARMLLWVLKGNTRARRFYERAGFAPDGAEEPCVVEGVPVPEVRYARPLSG
ncbi:GNAT family N-acetyltransferase [Streptomyces coelicoflavus]|uniref:GNAT family N-acetyltransferase n=1 Tax=Streptomyces coelicoflavus TaxID=285562 RepID=A0A7K3PU93_9ACTN|nr:GNAT family N-acetyltransferase [Streptomyces coelicoflavus]